VMRRFTLLMAGGPLLVIALGDGYVALCGHARASTGPGPGANVAPTHDMLACSKDSDCVTVPRVGCCDNGWKEAVNAASSTRYQASFACPDPHPICPTFVVLEERVPRCGLRTHECELVPADPGKRATSTGTTPPRRVVQTTAGPITLVGDRCCCAFVVEGDILKEDLREPSACAREYLGRCVLLDPNRYTPHPCCPGATGERCGD
jgi:hypothetical protein